MAIEPGNRTQIAERLRHEFNRIADLYPDHLGYRQGVCQEAAEGIIAVMDPDNHLSHCKYADVHELYLNTTPVLWHPGPAEIRDTVASLLEPQLQKQTHFDDRRHGTKGFRAVYSTAMPGVIIQVFEWEDTYKNERKTGYTIWKETAYNHQFADRPR